MRLVWPGRVAVCGVAILFGLGVPSVKAQQLELAFNDGLVTVVARDVTVRQVLEEWARGGQTEVVNAELLGNRRVSLELRGVPEAEAMDRLLAPVAGYVGRRRAGAGGRSDFALVLILATSKVGAADTTASVADSDAPSAGPPAIEPSVVAASVDAPSMDPNPDTDADPSRDGDAGWPFGPSPTPIDLFSSEATGRSPESRPVQGHVAPGAPIDSLPGDELPAGRPEGARPGARSSPTGPPAERVTAPGTPQQPGAAESPDANGRPARKTP